MGDSFVPQWQTGRASMVAMLKLGREQGHTCFAAKDMTASGVKSWASFPTYAEFCRLVMSETDNQRCFYELVTEETSICLWFDVEWKEPEQDVVAGDAERRRAKLEETLRVAVQASFQVPDPLMFFGISTRKEREYIKHSYQVRVPSVVFPRNGKEGALAKWVHQFIDLTQGDPSFICPVSQKHIVDHAVYSRSRCVRTCFSSKRSDVSHTALRLMFDIGSATIPGLVAVGQLSEFEALAVSAECRQYGGYACTRIREGEYVRCSGLDGMSPGSVLGQLQETTSVSTAAGRGRTDAAHRPVKRMRLGLAGAGGGVGGGGSARGNAENHGGAANANDTSSNSVQNVYERHESRQSHQASSSRDLSGEVVDCLAVLGARHAQTYVSWSQIMFAVRNCGVLETIEPAFLEWSKRASSYTDDEDLRRQLRACAPRVTGDDRHALGIASLRRAVREDPFLVFNADRDNSGFDSSGVASERVEWGSLLSNIDFNKTPWRILVRTFRLVWPHERYDILQDVCAKLQRANIRNPPSFSDIELVWEQPNCTCRRFCESMLAHIQQQLLWPELVMKTLPVLLGRSDGRNYTVTAYSCDNVSTLDITLVDDDEEGGSYVAKYRLKLASGQVCASNVNLMDRAFMFDKRNVTEIHVDYSHLSTHNWAKRVAEIPEVLQNLRYVEKMCWCVYQEQLGYWEEVRPDHPALQRYLSDLVRQHFRALWTFLDFKSAFDATADAQRQRLEKMLAKFSNDDFLIKLLTTLQANKEIRVLEFNDVFNRDKHVLPCSNGLLNLATLELRPLRREDYVTYCTPAVWDPAADLAGPREIMESLWPYDTSEVVLFMCRWLGYCLSAFTNLQIFVFMIGWGSNGKSKLSNVMQNILGKVAYGNVSYQALCMRTNAPNEELYDVRHARMWQIDENDTKSQLNWTVIKNVSGEDGLRCRQLYGHNVKLPARAKMNFAVNHAPILPDTKDFKESASISRRAVFIDMPAQFVDFSPNSKDTDKIENFRQDLGEEKFAKCVKQVDVNLDKKLECMTSGFLRMFAEAAQPLYANCFDVSGKPTITFNAIDIPLCVRKNMSRMMKSNPSLKADEFLNTMYEPGTSGDLFLREIYTTFLCAHDLEEHNFSSSRFESDLDKWIHLQNGTHPNCKAGNFVKKNRVLRGEKKGQVVIKNIARVHMETDS